MKKFKAVLNVFSWILSFFMLFMVAAAVVLVLLGYKFFSVSTGSMEPTYPVGTLVVVQPTDFDALGEDDVITFKSGGAVITHRIISIDPEERLIYTKGDNNNVEDSAPVPYDNVIGKVVYGISRLGYLVLFAKTKRGMIVCTGIIVIIFLTHVIVNDFSEDEGDDDDSETD